MDLDCLHAAASILAEAEVPALDDDVGRVLGHHPVEERFGRLPEQLVGRHKRNHVVGTRCAKPVTPLAERRETQGRRCRSQDRQRVRIEAQGNHPPTVTGGIPRGLDERRVPSVHTVKGADCDRCR